MKAKSPKKRPFSVGFETKCWEGDWEYLLKTDRLKKMIHNCQYPFVEKNLIINNVKDLKAVLPFAENAIKNGIIHQYYIAEEYEDRVLDFFELPSTFKKEQGYRYSISELVGLYLSNAEYLLHFSSDTMLIQSGSHWIPQAIEVFTADEKTVAASPSEDRHASQKSLEKGDSSFKTWVFSDQCYLVPVRVLKKPIYCESNEGTKVYPDYGGNSFEKRVGAYFLNHDLARIVFADAYFYSMNFSHLNRIKPLLIWIGKDYSKAFSRITDFRRALKRLSKR